MPGTGWAITAKVDAFFAGVMTCHLYWEIRNELGNGDAMKNQFRKSILFISVLMLSACSSANSLSIKESPLSAKSLYLECQSALKTSSTIDELSESSCNQKISFFLLGLTYGSVSAPVPENLRSQLFEDSHKMNQRSFDCAQQRGYVVAENVDDKIFGSRGVNLPATFVKWVDVDPEKRLSIRSSEAVLSAFFDTCKR